MKQCKKCGERKPLDKFYKDKSSRDGYQSWCIFCKSAYCKAWVEANPSYHKEWRKANPEKEKLKQQKWRVANKPKKAALQNLRHTAKLKATVPWADLDKMEEFYRIAAYLSDNTNHKWHVDHIIPLKGKLVCGLHVEGNLRVVPAKINTRKGNKFDVDDYVHMI